MNRPSDEIVQRMVTLITSMSSKSNNDHLGRNFFSPEDQTELFEIRNLLQPPVDPDVLAAREIYKSGIRNIRPEISEAINNGQYDNYDYLVGCIAGIRHARAATADDDWIEWHGGDCPVAAGAPVLLKLRDGTTYDWSRPELSRWCHNSNAGDIIAYRIVTA